MFATPITRCRLPPAHPTVRRRCPTHRPQSTLGRCQRPFVDSNPANQPQRRMLEHQLAPGVVRGTARLGTTDGNVVLTTGVRRYLRTSPRAIDPQREDLLAGKANVIFLACKLSLTASVTQEFAQSAWTFLHSVGTFTNVRACVRTHRSGAIVNIAQCACRVFRGHAAATTRC